MILKIRTQLCNAEKYIFAFCLGKRWESVRIKIFHHQQTFLLFILLPYFRLPGRDLSVTDSLVTSSEALTLTPTPDSPPVPQPRRKK